jgi:galactokinase
MTSQEPQRPSADDLEAAFVDAFDHAPDGVWSAPGRVNLIGEHTDYNEGFVLPFAINRTARVAIRRRDDQRVRLMSSYAGADPAEADLTELSPETLQGWAAYPLGVVWALQQEGVDVPGFDLYLESSVPTGAGLSSSAAVECAVALALNDLAKAGLSRPQLVQVGRRAENEVVGAPTGILDQSASLLATDGHAVFLDCRTQESRLVPLDLSAAGLGILVIDTKVSHAHSTGGYGDRRASCEAGARTAGVGSLRDLAVADLPRLEAVLDPETYTRVRHILTENERVLQAAELLPDQGPKAIGSILNASHDSMRDDFEISCPELDLAVSTAQRAGALGARMTGGGFGGSAIALVHHADEETVRAAVLEAFAAAGFRRPDVFVVEPAQGATRLR